MGVDTTLSPGQRSALDQIGVPADRVSEFLDGKQIAFPFATESVPGVAVVRYLPPRLSCGIVEINDPGGGVKSIARFRGQARYLAASFEVTELELFGAEVLNERLKKLLLSHGFMARVEDCPDELGDDKMTIFARIDPV